MDVTQAVERRLSVRAFKPDPVPGALVREILELAARAPSGGNLQPWRVYALAGEEMERFRAFVRPRLGSPDDAEYDVYPANLWEPFRTRRFQAGEDLYATLGIAREDKVGRLTQFAKNGEFFGAPVGLFVYLDRNVGPPQWSDVGMFMQTLMLLAVERGLDTCSQEFWSRFHGSVGEFLKPPPELMLFSGMALGYRDEAHPINALRTRRDPLEAWCELRGFD